MKIAIMGAGFVGESLARALTKVGYEVILSSRNPSSDKIQTLIQDIDANIQAGTVEETLAFSDVIAIALQYDDALEIVQAGDWSDKIILDMTQGDMQKLQDLTGASVVKIFNSIGAEHYQTPVFGDNIASMFYCGDNSQAKEIAEKIATDIGFEAIDAGDNSMGQHLVNLAQFWVALMINGSGRDFAFKMIKR